MNPALRIPAEFVAPSTEDAHLPPFFEVGSFAFGKHSLLILLSVVLIAAFFMYVVRRRELVVCGIGGKRRGGDIGEKSSATARI